MARKHNILHVLGTARAENTGMVRIVTTLAAGLDPDKYALHACFLDGKGPLAEELERGGVSVFFANWARGARDPVGASRFWRAIWGQGFAIAHIHFGGRSIRWLARRAGAHVVVHLHGFGPESQLQASSPIRTDGAHTVIACSQAVAAKVVGARARVVYAGIPVTDLTAKQHAEAAGSDSMIIGAAGRLVPIKGFQYLIRAFALVQNEFPKLRLEIAGDGPEYGHLDDEIRRLGLTDKVVLCGWQQHLTPLFDNWDLYVQPSLREGFPMAVLEAMASGLPILASNVGGLPELIKNGVTGWLVEQADPDALAERIRWMARKKEARRAMGRAAHARVRDRFSSQRMVSETIRIYAALIGERCDSVAAV